LKEGVAYVRERETDGPDDAMEAALQYVEDLEGER
jgi:hypothetical protein